MRMPSASPAAPLAVKCFTEERRVSRMGDTAGPSEGPLESDGKTRRRNTRRESMEYMAEQYDLVVLGAGPGGYVAAIRAAQLGMKVAVVEKEKVGGVCLHKGCIPTKSLLRSAEVYHEMKHGEDYGITAEGVRVYFSRVQKRKEKV